MFRRLWRLWVAVGLAGLIATLTVATAPTSATAAKAKPSDVCTKVSVSHTGAGVSLSGCGSDKGPDRPPVVERGGSGSLHTSAGGLAGQGTVKWSGAGTEWNGTETVITASVRKVGSHGQPVDERDAKGKSCARGTQELEVTGHVLSDLASGDSGGTVSAELCSDPDGRASLEPGTVFAIGEGTNEGPGG
jgi:hypothetical protein